MGAELDAGHVKGHLDLDTTGFKGGFEEVHTHAETEGARIREVMESIAEVANEVMGPAFAQVGQQIQSAFAGFSEGPVVGSLNLVGLVLGHLREATVDVAKDFHEIDIEAKRASVSTEFLGRIAAVGKTVDLPIQSISRSFAILEQRADEALGPGGEKVAGAFERVGISVEDLGQLSNDPEKLFEAVQEGLFKITKATERASAARELLGRGGLLLQPILQMNKEEFDKTAESIEGLEGSATKANVTMANDFNKLQVEVGAAMSGIALDLATPVLTWISAHKDEIEADIKKVASAVKDNLGAAFDYLAAHKDDIVAGFNQWLQTFKELAPLVSAVGSGVSSVAHVVADVAHQNAPQNQPAGGHRFWDPKYNFNDLYNDFPAIQHGFNRIGPMAPFYHGADAIEREFGGGSQSLNLPAWHDLDDHIRATTDALSGLRNKADDVNNAPIASAAETPSQRAGVRNNTSSPPVNVSVNYDSRDSVNQLAAKLHPQLRKIGNDVRSRFEADAMMGLAKASMGGVG